MTTCICLNTKTTTTNNNSHTLADGVCAIEHHESGGLELVARALQLRLGDILRHAHAELHHRVREIIELVGGANTFLYGKRKN